MAALFEFNTMIVGEFSDGIPAASGDLHYMPYRGIGHYEMQRTLKETGQAVCTLRSDEQVFTVTVIACPQYGVLTASEIKRS